MWRAHVAQPIGMPVVGEKLCTIVKANGDAIRINPRDVLPVRRFGLRCCEIDARGQIDWCPKCARFEANRSIAGDWRKREMRCGVWARRKLTWLSRDAGERASKLVAELRCRRVCGSTAQRRS